MFPGLDLYCTDPAQHLITAGEELDDRDPVRRVKGFPEESGVFPPRKVERFAHADGERVRGSFKLCLLEIHYAAILGCQYIVFVVK